MTRSAPSFSTSGDERPGCLGPMVYLVLLVAGLAILYAFFLEPFKLAFESMRWEKTPCVIIRSQVAPAFSKEKPGTPKSDKPKPEPRPNTDEFKADIVYRYTYNDKVHRSSTIWFLKPSPDTRANIQAIVDRYPVESQTFCYVNPKDPDSAVLERGLKPELLIALAPLLMVLIGAAGLLSRAAAILPRRHVEAPQLPPNPTPPPPTGRSPIVRHPKSGLFPIIFLFLFSGFWNFVVSFLVREVISNWKHGVPSCSGLFLTAFAVPFVVVGVVTAVAPFYFILKLFNPRPTLTFSSDSLPLGGILDVAWRFDGKTDRIFRLRITAEGREEATYRRGTSTYTDREVFRTIPLIDTQDPALIAAGHARLSMPPDTMHSFSGGHNSIVWAIKIVGEIHRWPDVNEDFDITVLPLQEKRA